MQPLVSIIIPTYNRAALIGQTLKSVMKQLYTNWECIVVDDGSTDATVAVIDTFIARDSRFKYYSRPVTSIKGSNTCRNLGFEKSKGEFVNWFDDDDIMLPEFISDKIKLMQTQINLVICTGDYVDKDLHFISKLELFSTPTIFKEFTMWRLKVLTPGVLFRKSFLNNKHLFSEMITRGQEAEFFSRLFFQLPYESYTILNKSLFLYRQHSDSKTVFNKHYQFENKESHFYILVQNLVRSEQLNDRELLMKLYSDMVKLFFEAVEHRHNSLAKKVLKQLTGFVYKRNTIKSIEVILLGYGILTINRTSYTLRKRWLQFSFE